MTPMFLRGCSVAAGLAVSMAALAQTAGQQTGQAQPRTQTTTPAPPAPWVGRSNGHGGGLHPE